MLHTKIQVLTWLFMNGIQAYNLVFRERLFYKPMNLGDREHTVTLLESSFHVIRKKSVRKIIVLNDLIDASSSE